MRSTDTDARDTFAGSAAHWMVTMAGAAAEMVRGVTWSCWASGTPPTEAIGDAEKQVNGCIAIRDDAVLTGGGALLWWDTTVIDAGAPGALWTCWVAHAATGSISTTRMQERNLTSIGPLGVGRTLSTCLR